MDGLDVHRTRFAYLNRPSISFSPNCISPKQLKDTMMRTTMAVEDIKVTLPELLDSLTPGDEVILSKNHQPVATLVSQTSSPVPKLRPGPGLGKEMITFIAEDFDVPLDDMKEYME